MLEKLVIEKPVKVIKANYLLKDKVGFVKFNATRVEKCQLVLDNNAFDFLPYAQSILDELSASIQEIKENRMDRDAGQEEIAQCVMQLKATASLFKYELMGNLAKVMLNFIEHIHYLDDHAIEIVSAHHKTLTIIVSRKMSGHCGDIGQRFEEELMGACTRYFNKKKN